MQTLKLDENFRIESINLKHSCNVCYMEKNKIMRKTVLIIVFLS